MKIVLHQLYSIAAQMMDEKNENENVYFVNKCGLNSKDLDHFSQLKKKEILLC